MVFDRGVDAISNSYYSYSEIICKTLKSLLSNQTTNDSNQNSMDLFHAKFKMILDRSESEFTRALNQLDAEQMAYNEIRFTKLSCHLMFLSKLGSNLQDKSIQSALKSFMSRVESEQSLLNCFIQFNCS